MTATMIPDPKTKPHMTPAEAAELYQLSKPTTYEQLNAYLTSGGTTGIPCVRLGHKFLVITAKVREQFGLDAEPTAA